MLEHERRLVEAAIAFVDTEPNDVAFPKAYETLVCVRGEYQIVAEARLGDPLKNDAGAFSANSRPTSIAAAFTIPNRGMLRGKMLDLFANDVMADEPGWTDFELVHFLPRTKDGELRDPRTVASCRRDLVRYGWIEESGETRLNDTRPCIVHVMTELGRQKYEELYANG